MVQMEKQGFRSRRNSDGKNRKRKPEEASEIHNFHFQTDSESKFNTVFGILIASLLRFDQHPKPLLSLIKICLDKLLLYLDQDLPIDPILSLLPTILRSKCPKVASRAAEIVGAASLVSLETNERVALDGETMRALVSALASTNRKVSMAACNAVLDLRITSVGSESLLSCSALEALIFRFFQLPNSSTSSISLCNMEGGSITCLNIGFKGDELTLSILKAAVNLLNTCNAEQLANIPRKLSKPFLASLTDMWAQVHRERFFHNTINCNQEEGPFHISNYKIEAVAESIFRLAISDDRLSVPLPLDVVQRGIFGQSSSGFEDFISHLWEVSPSLVGRLSGASTERDGIFNPFLQSLNATETFPSFLSRSLQNMVSCLPIDSDELDILNFLKEVGHKLGCPIIYQQDLRVIRTNRHLKTEEHFFPFVSDSHSAEDSHVFNIDDILKCDEAFREGYTVALRGMEFRFRTIAPIADGLASLFGQPSVGVNMYLTPLDSQGLACHYDDHCVFVCQLLGTKKWKVFSHSNMQLPRLYEPLDNSPCSEVNSSISGCKLFTLRQGDILYIPRGFLHEAYTEMGPNSSGYSLHLTFGIEVEPPFEWEGFVHVALCCWNQSQERNCSGSECSAGIVFDISVVLLHLAICLIGDSDPLFRKACLAAATAPPSNSDDWLDLNQRKMFCRLIDKVNAESSFSEALRNVEIATQKRKDPFQQMGWLRNLDLCSETSERLDLNMPFSGTEELFQLSVRYKREVETAFMQAKSRFCCEILYEDVKQSYRTLLEKYRKVRKQYTNGTISLHRLL